MTKESILAAELDELRRLLERVDISEGDLIPLMQEAINNWTPDDLNNDVGEVVTVGDGIATVKGLKEVKYGAIH